MKFLRSIRWQIQAWHALLLAVITALLLVTAWRHEKNVRLQLVDAELQHALILLMPRYVAPRGFPGPPAAGPGPSSGVDPVAELLARGGYFAVFGKDGEIAHRSAGAPEVSRPVPTGRPVTAGRWEHGNRESFNLTPWGESVVVGMRGERIFADSRTLALRLAAVGLCVMAVGVAGGAWIAGRALCPIREINAAARQIAEGDWSRRIPAGRAAAELAGLADTLNATFDRLDAAYEQQKRFTADASHELGTPVSVILSSTQLALSKPREAPEYIAALEACRRAGERMKTLTADLLDLAEYDAGIPPARLVACDLAEIAREAIAAVQPLADARRAEIREDLESVAGHFHPAAISQVFINLLANAIRHNDPGVRVTLRLRREGSSAVAEIIDTGAGIPAAALPHLFERFHRADQARSRDRGGSGLGLAICKAIVEAHHGSLSAANAAEGGAVFRITLPA